MVQVLNAYIDEKKTQAGAELCEAQGKLKLVCLWLTFGFASLAHEFNFGALILFIWKFWFSKFGLVW